MNDNPPVPVSETGSSLAVTVQGTCAIYLAGRDDVQIPPLDGDTSDFPLMRCGGYAPETFPVALSAPGGASLSFRVIGAMDFWGGEAGIGADGTEYSGVDSLGAISGYTGPQGALVGLFLDDDNPAHGSAPRPIDFTPEGSTGLAFGRLTPALGQVFFIGDGLTGDGTGSAQTFVAPSGATRLFLGLADAPGFWGAPGCYEDNVGSYQVTVNSSAPIQLVSANQ